MTENETVTPEAPYESAEEIPTDETPPQQITLPPAAPSVIPDEDQPRQIEQHYIMPCPQSYEEMRAMLATDEMKIEKEIVETPVRIQQVVDESIRLGKIVESLKLKERALEGLIWKNYKVQNPKATVDDLKKHLQSHQALIDIQREIVEAEGRYDQWYNLVRSFRDKRQALEDYKSMILTGYVGYKRAASLG